MSEKKEYIERGELKSHMMGITFVDPQQYINVLFDCVNHALAADVEPVVRGEWIHVEEIESESIVKCSNCGNPKSAFYKTVRCDYCGAYLERSGSGETD